MMDVILKQIIERIIEKALSLSKDFHAICFTILLVITCSPDIRRWIKIDSFYAEYRPWIVLPLLYCGLSILYKALGNWRVSRQQARQDLRRIWELGNLPQEEKAIIHQLLQPEMDRIWLSVDNPAAANLWQRKIIKRIAPDLLQERRGLYDVTVPGYWYCLSSEIQRISHYYSVNPQNYYKYVRFKCRYMLHSLQFCVILS
jgi:hypothetical protein